MKKRRGSPICVGRRYSSQGGVGGIIGRLPIVRPMGQQGGGVVGQVGGMPHGSYHGGRQSNRGPQNGRNG